ncbi:MAG: hypothetical protein M3436_19595 [Pseudomonadota bacterium]|nr:hypothetical protein [Pseudomonadota bacterium]
MKLVLTVLRWSLIGALTSAVIMALYRYYIITSSGFSVASVPIKTMMIDVMGLPLHAGMGAGVGALLGMVIAIRAALRARNRRPDAAMDTSSPTLEDVDTKLRAINRQKAERYLAQRKRKR